MAINRTISSEQRLEKIEERMDKAVTIARKEAEDTPLVLAIHPRLDWFFKMMADLPEDAELRGIAGERNIMVTDSVDCFRIIICNENL